MDPIDYSGAFANVQSPIQAFTQGLQGGAALQQVEAEQTQQAAAAAQRQQMQADLAALSANPTPDAIARASLKYPQLSEQFKRSLDMLTPEQQRAKIESAAPVHAAALAGEYGIAAQQLRDHAQALENSGNPQEAQQTRAMADLIEKHPETATVTTGMLLASAMGPDKYASAFKDIGTERRADQMQPAEVRKANADATGAEADAVTKGVTAKYADQGALLDLEKKGWDIKALQSDIDYKGNQTKIGYLNAQLNKETNGLKRQELELQIHKAQQDQADKVRSKVADAESAAASIDNMLNTIQRVQKHPALKDVVGSVEGRDWYPNTLAAAATTATPYGLVSSSGEDRADAIKLIETLGSQAFLAQVPAMKGQGSLSNAEGEKLQAALTNLSRAQSEKQFNANLEDAARILTKARGTVSKRYGVPLGNPDTPAASSKRPPLASFGG
jgi:hypothetical protein